MQQTENSGALWMAAMRRGDLHTAWRIADSVLATRNPAGQDDPRLPYHQRWVWDGRRFDGHDVLVRCYHGLGDTLQFARYLPALRSRAASVTLEVQPALAAWAGLLPGIDRIAPFDAARPLPAATRCVEIMELSHALRLGPDDTRPLAPTLEPSALGAGRTALCWQAGDWNEARSVPLAGLLEALGPGRFVSLQRGPAAAEARSGSFVNPGDDDPDVLRTARLILGARRVVTVDTMVAHLAGSLAAETLLLLPHDPDWRWGASGGDSAWYPSVTLLRQDAPGDWSAPLAALRCRAAG